MARRLPGILLLLVCVIVFCGSLHAQNEKTITIRMLDSRTGLRIATSDFLVRVNHNTAVHANWVQQNDDGTGKLTVPEDATVLSIQATYNTATQFYINCDSAGEKPTPQEHWYKVSEILATGVVAPNGCGKLLRSAKQTVVAKPGEFVFFVRKENMREQMQDF